MRFGSWTQLFAAVLSLTSVTCCQMTQAYELRLVMNDGQSIAGEATIKINDEEPLPVSINSSGEFPFLVELADHRSAIATTSRVVVRNGDTIAGVSAAIRDEDHQPRISEDGRVLFSTLSAVFFGNEVVYRAGDPLSGLDTPLDQIGFGPAMNQQNDIAFLGSIRGEGSVVATIDGVVAKTGDTIDERTISNIADVHVLEDGRVAFQAAFRVDDDSPMGYGVFTSDEPLMLAGTVIDGRTMTVPNLVGQTDDGTLIYIGSDPGSGFHPTSIFSNDKVFVASGEEVNGKILSDVSFASVNGKGQIAYTSNFIGGRGVFVDDTLVAEIGDIIEGHEITSIDRAVIGPNGDLAISLQVANRGWAMAVATVPEPPSFLLVMAGLISIARHRRLAEATARRKGLTKGGKRCDPTLDPYTASQ